MIRHLLNRTVDVWREESVPDGSGGWVSEWAWVHKAIPTRIAQPTATERALAMQSGVQLDGRAYVQPSMDVQRGDELRGDGETFRVIATVGPSAPGVYRRADLEGVQHAEGGP